MKRLLIILTGFFLLSLFQLSAQEYTAARYWNMEHDPLYTNLLDRQNKGDTLSAEEQKILADYKVKLSEYFEKLSDSEKAVYYKNRSVWTEKPSEMYKVTPPQQTDVYSGERSKFTQYLVTNGIFGALYGGATAAVLGVEDQGAVTGMVLVPAGLSMLIPVFTIKEKFVSYNSLSLSIHGKAMGAVQGLALGTLITGDNVEDGKLLLALSVASSITLGRVGYSLGKNKPWTEGRVALYSYYGTLMPFEGLALDFAFEFEDPRLYGLTSLAFGAGGYLMADRIANKTDFTRGDITAVGTLAAMNGLLALFATGDILVNDDEDFQPSLILIPAATTLGASFLGQAWLRNAKLTSQQGRNVALATTGGVIVGVGIAAIFQPDAPAAYYIPAYLTGMTTYSLMVGMYKKSNSQSIINKEKNTGWNFNIMPQNIFLNKKIASYAFANPGKRVNFLPAFSATLKF